MSEAQTAGLATGRAPRRGPAGTFEATPVPRAASPFPPCIQLPNSRLLEPRTLYHRVLHGLTCSKSSSCCVECRISLKPGLGIDLDEIHLGHGPHQHSNKTSCCSCRNFPLGHRQLLKRHLSKHGRAGEKASSYSQVATGYSSQAEEAPRCTSKIAACCFPG